MADPIVDFNSILGGTGLNFANPMGLLTNIILSTIVGGVVILILVELLAKKYHESIKISHAFMLALIINIVNIPIVMGLLYSAAAAVPFVGMIVSFLPIIIWIVFTKLLFPKLKFTHTLIIAIVGYLLSIYLIPMLIAMVSGYIPAI